MHNHDEINADGVDDQDDADTAQVDGELPSSAEHAILDLDGLVDSDADSSTPQATPGLPEILNEYPWLATYEKGLGQWAAQAAAARDTVNTVLASQRYLAGLFTAERRIADTVAAARVPGLHEQVANLAMPAIGKQFVEQVMPNLSALTGGTGFYTPAMLAAQQFIAGPDLSVHRTMGQLWSSVAALNAWQPPMWDMVKTLDSFRWWSQQQLSVTSFFTQDFRQRLFDALRAIRDHLDDEELDGEQAGWFARGLYRAALIAREAVLTDLESAPKVRAFARQWLRIQDVSQYVLDAVIDVLLDDDWHELSLPDNQLHDYLVGRVKERHAVTRPITERTLNYRRIQSLSAPVVTAEGTVTTLEQVVAHPRTLDDEVFDRLGTQWGDERLIRVYGKLDDDGRLIVDTWANGDDLTWRQAGDLAGHGPDRGEAIRRRLHYLAREQGRRQLLRPGSSASSRGWDR